MRHPIIKSKKQYIRLWFEYYRITLDDPEYTQNLKTSKDYYYDWGKIEKDTKFDIWWKDHKKLFGDERVKEIDRVSNHPNNLNISVPLNLPVTETLRSVRDLIEGKQSKRLVELGLDPKKVKSKNIGFGKYELTQGVEVRGRTLNEILIVYQKYSESGKPPINMDFVMKVHRELENRPRSKWSLYFIGNPETKTDLDNVVRYMRRMVQRGSKICKSVSLGQFPGKSKLD